MPQSNKHTPGPWWIDHADDVDLPNHVGISSESHGLLAQVVWKMDNHKRTPSCEANASLIAAAPELLEALQGFMEGAEAMGWNTTKARAAIAKATGEMK